MRIAILLFAFSAILNRVTAPSPFNPPSTNLPNVKTGLPVAPKIPKRYDFTSKTDFKKSIKNSSLTNLLKATSVKKLNETKAEKDKNDEKNIANTKDEGKNTNKSLNADKEIIIDEKLQIKDKPMKVDFEDETNTSDITKSILRNEEKSTPTKTKVKDLKPLELPPTMIPIFKPNPNVARSQINENIDPIPNTIRSNMPVQDATPIIGKAKDANPNVVASNIPIMDFIPNTARTNVPAQDFTPEPTRFKPGLSPIDKQNTLVAAKGNLNLNSNAAPFIIPCHKASDVLKEIPTKPEFCLGSIQSEPLAKDINTNLQQQKSVGQAEIGETDESVAIIFKPKNISLFNVYGDILKKITLTVLVPYHISKLGT